MRINHKYIRYIPIICLFFLFVITNACILGQTTDKTPTILSPSEIIKSQFEQQASKQLGLPVKVSGISMGYSSIELTGIKIGKKNQKNSAHAEIEKISAVCNFMSLLSGTLEISELTIISSSFTLSRKFLNKLSKSKGSTKKKVAVPNEFPLSMLKGKNIRFHIIDPGIRKTLHITLPELSLIKSTSKNVGTLKFNGRMSANSAPVNFKGNLIVRPSYPYFVSGKVSLNKVSAKSCLAIVNNVLNKKFNSTKVTQGNIEASIKVQPGKADAKVFKLWFKSKDLTLINNGMKVNKLSLQTSASIPFPEYMNVSAQMNIDNGSIFASNKIGRPITNLKGKINISSNKCVVNSLSMNWGKSAVKIMGNIQDLQKFNTNLTYTVNPLNLNDAGKYFLAKSPYKVYGSGKAAGKIKGVFSSLTIDGHINLPKTSLSLSMKGYNQPYVFPFINVRNTFKYSNGIFNIIKVTSILFGGQLTGTGKVFLTKNPVQFKFNATGNSLRAEKFLSSNSTQKNVVTGPLNFGLDGSGNVNGLNTWNGKGKMSMTNGEYSTPPVVSPILSALNLKEFSSGTISTAIGNFNLVNGILNTNDLNCITNVGKAFYRGSIGLDTSLNGKMNLVFAPNAVKKSQILREISKNGTTVSIPTKVRGTLLKPSFPGFKATKLLELGLKRKGEKMLQEILFGKPKNEPNEASQEASNGTNKTPQNSKNVFNDLINIFKKKKKKTPVKIAPPVAPTQSAPTQILRKKKNTASKLAPIVPTRTDATLTILKKKKKTKKSKFERSLDKELKKLFRF